MAYITEKQIEFFKKSLEITCITWTLLLLTKPISTLWPSGLLRRIRLFNSHFVKEEKGRQSLAFTKREITETVEVGKTQSLLNTEEMKGDPFQMEDNWLSYPLNTDYL